jgi:hypothetical protein
MFAVWNVAVIGFTKNVKSEMFCSYKLFAFLVYILKKIVLIANAKLRRLLKYNKIYKLNRRCEINKFWSFFEKCLSQKTADFPQMVRQEDAILKYID